MELPDVIIRIAETGGCPLYQKGDDIRLSGYALSFPHGRATCIVLVMDVAEAFSEWETGRECGMSPPPMGGFHCSGCDGRIRVEYGPEGAAEADPGGEAVRRAGPVAALLKDFSIFESLEARHIDDIVPYLKVKKYQKGERIISRGDPGRHLYIILAGKVEVLSGDDLHMAFLEKGDVFGEMSLLSGDPVGATVGAVEPTPILYLHSRDFRQVLNQHPPLQMYFARLLAKRLARSNKERADEFASGMAGQLSEMPPAELFQALNVNQKTGLLGLSLTKGPAEVVFREGELVGARFDDQGDKEAFYHILMQKEGRFKFSPHIPDEYADAPELGNFMWLLMEGARMQDEADAAESA